MTSVQTSNPLIQGRTARLLNIGVVAQTAAKTVPQNATQTIFTVSGGRVLITCLYGLVTTVIGGTTPAAKLVATPATGTANDMSATLTITSFEVGAMIALAGPVASALNGQSKSGSVAGQSVPQIVAPGTIGVNVSAADATGAIQWTLCYVPLDRPVAVIAN